MIGIWVQSIKPTHWGNPQSSLNPLDMSTNSLTNTATITFAANAIPAFVSNAVTDIPSYLGMTGTGVVVGTKTVAPPDNLGNGKAIYSLNMQERVLFNTGTVTFATRTLLATNGSSVPLASDDDIDRFLVTFNASGTVTLGATRTSAPPDNLGDHIAIGSLNMATNNLSNTGNNYMAF